VATQACATSTRTAPGRTARLILCPPRPAPSSQPFGPGAGRFPCRVGRAAEVIPQLFALTFDLPVNLVYNHPLTPPAGAPCRLACPRLALKARPDNESLSTAGPATASPGVTARPG
jgi:hypothetical protein